jgi:hypothetical protein
LVRKTLALLSALLSALIFSTFTLSTLAFAEGTRTWEQSKFEELIKGTPKGVALRSEGGLELAPAFKTIVTTPSTYIWSTPQPGRRPASIASRSTAKSRPSLSRRSCRCNPW